MIFKKPTKLETAVESLKQERAKARKESAKALSEQMRVCRKEIEQYVATNTILLEENKLLKEIEKTKEYIKEKEISDNDVIEIEDCSDDEEDKNADIDDTAAAATFLRNKKDSEAQKQKATGARQKKISAKK